MVAVNQIYIENLQMLFFSKNKNSHLCDFVPEISVW